MSFAVTAAAYDQFMGRWSEPLAAQFASLGAFDPGQRLLDVGCGPGALTAVLAARVGSTSVYAVDPSESFVAATRDRLPDVDVRRASAEALPFPDATFDGALAQLVVHFMDDPVGGLTELARVTRPGGTVAACVWDHAGRRGPLSIFWDAVLELDPAARDESGLPGAREGHLVELFAAAGITDSRQTTLTVRRTFADVDAWWTPFTLGVGPAGAYVSALDPGGRDRLRHQCAQLLPDGSFELAAVAWAAVGRA